MATLATPKPVNHLTLEDLSIFPVWEFGLDEESLPGRDETWVRPVASNVVPTNSWSQLVAAEFSSRAWTGSLRGFMDITTAKRTHLDQILRNRPDMNRLLPEQESEDYSTSGGAIISSMGYHFISSGISKHHIRARSALATALGSEPADVFPIRYRLLVAFEGESTCREGIIN